MPTQDEEIARHLRQALASGELAQAPGFGKPLVEDADWHATPESLRMPFKILKNAGFHPPEVELFNERAALADQLRHCTDDATRMALGRRLSELQQRLALRLESLQAHGSL